MTNPTGTGWHRAEAAFGPDELMAADLERAADRAEPAVQAPRPLRRCGARRS